MRDELKFTSRLGMVLVGTALALTGCSAGSPIAALERDAQPSDAWPGDTSMLEGFDPASVRNLGTHEGTDYFVLASEDRKSACIYRFSGDGSAEDGMGGCGGLEGGQVIVTVGALDTRMSLVADDAMVDDLLDTGWIRINQNVLIPAS
ncbi:hypothetical protein [Glutamicibacter sp. NPDC087344]|uniref:hypothetical protein n=1 Tax=Glutamicibacter sp. NPDC087344 TaxID=3363994 RepID=UPI0038306706